MDEQKPRDVFFFEQDGAFVVRLLLSRPGRAASHELAEFTRDDIAELVARGPGLRNPDNGPRRAEASKTRASTRRYRP